MGHNKLIMDLRKKQAAVNTVLVNGEIPTEQAEELNKEYDALLAEEDERHQLAVQNFKRSSKKWRKTFRKVIKHQSV